MRKIYFLLLPFFFFVSNVNSQDAYLDWYGTFGGPAGGAFQSYPKALARNSAGDLFSVGIFQATSDFDPGAGTSNLTSAGLNDIYVMRLNSLGVLNFNLRIGGTGDDQALAMALDASSNIYITGSFSGTVDFDPGAGTTSLTSNGLEDIFVLKLNSSGVFQWVAQMGSTGTDIGRAITVDATENVFLTGEYAGTVDFDPGAGTTNLTSLGGAEIFVCKLDAGGNLALALSMGGTSTDRGRGITLDGSGNIITTGSYTGLSADLDPGAAFVNPGIASQGEIYISKLDPSGNFIWVDAVRDFGSGTGLVVKVDPTDNIFVSGSFSGGSTDFDPGAGIFNIFGTSDGFLLKLNSAGTFVWAKAIQGAGSEMIQYFTMNASTGDIIVTGTYTDSVDVDPGAGTNYHYTNGTAFTENTYLVKLNSSGNLLWAKDFGARNGFDLTKPGGVVTDGLSNVYLQGTFMDSLDIDPGAGVQMLNSAGTLNFIVNLDDCSHTATATPGGPTTFCAGGSVLLSANTGAGYVYQWQLNGADISGATSSTYSVTASGNYDVVISYGGCDITSSTVAVTVNPMPSGTITAGGSTTFCVGSSVTLFGPSGVGYSYQWKLNGSNISGANSSNYSASASGDYTLTVTANGCSVTSNTITVTVNPVPNAVLTAGGPTTFCSGQSVVLTVSPSTGYTYSWTFNGSPIGGVTTSSITATGNGFYEATVSSGTCSDVSNSITVNVIPSPSATITPGGPTTFCVGGSVTLNANTGVGLSYQWLLNGNVISGATGTSYVASNDGDYVVVVTGSGCSTQSSITHVTLLQLPFPFFSWSSTGLAVTFTNMSVGAVSYSWAFGDAGTATAPSPTHNYATSGTYTVELTATNSCGSSQYFNNITIADTVNSGDVSVAQIDNLVGASLYPNPVDKLLTIDLKLNSAEKVRVELVSVVGEVLYSVSLGETQEKVFNMDMEQLANGIYFVKIYYGEKIKAQKVIKL